MNFDRHSAIADKTAILRRHDLFRELAPESCARIAAYAKTKEVARGVTIFSKGDPGACMFAVVRGRVRVATSSSEGKSAVLNQIEEGEVFGEIALLDGRPRTADAIAATDCVLMVLERRDFTPVLQTNPDIAIKLLEILSARLRRTTEQVEELMFMDLRGRLAKTLLRLSDRDGAIAVSQTELSQMVGMSREMINRQLHSWARDGLVGVERRRVTVLKPEALAAAAR